MPRHLLYVFFLMMLSFCAAHEDFEEFVSCCNDTVRMMAKTDKAMEEMATALQSIFAVPSDKRTYENSIYAYDEAVSRFSSWTSFLYALCRVHPDAVVRDCAHSEIVRVRTLMSQRSSENLQLYIAFKEYEAHGLDTTEIDNEERHYLQELISSFEEGSLGFSDEHIHEYKEITDELNHISMLYEQAIAHDRRSLLVHKKDLFGIDPYVCASLASYDDDIVIVPVNAATRATILSSCHSDAVRELLWQEYYSRGYPENEERLKKIIALRDRLARLFGYESYAAFEIEDQMAETPATVERFLSAVQERTIKKTRHDLALLLKNLPAGVTLSPEGKMKPWDVAYIVNQYAKKRFSYDKRAMDEYFPLDQTIQALFYIYEQFFNIRCELHSMPSLWHDDVLTIKIYDKKNNAFLGSILLDLFPRPYKYTHFCHISLIPSSMHRSGAYQPGTSLVIGNFSSRDADGIARLPLSEVVTFFHEFGHALHALFGATKIRAYAGTRVKKDFVEMPSQMLEEWLSDKDILKLIASYIRIPLHVSDAVLDAYVQEKAFLATYNVQEQITLAQFSLECFKEGEKKDPHALLAAIHERNETSVLFDDRCHLECAFGHLIGYGPLYYGYLWSEVYATDLFEHIKKHGLLNSVIGEQYRAKVLAKGGSVHPMALLIDFLGREPSIDAFFRKIGVDKE